MYGPFEVVERLGIGGMATVHRAIERGIEGFERVVALKRLLPHLAEDEAFVRAFVREAKLASLLQHGNIVQLYELGRVGPSYFISMEYIRGRDVRRVLRQAKRVTGPLPVPIAVAIVSELLDALDYAHTRTDDNGNPLGLVHRDISPSNLILSLTGHLKVIDFGIAKATLGHLATHTGRIKGKLSYMAPEALTGKALDNRSDLFSASIIAHELLTAHPLFAARNDFHTIERVQGMEAPPPSERNPEVPPSLDALVMRGLSKDSSHRWRSAGEMRAALAEITLRHRLHCTNREVADWVEIAFALGNSAELAPASMVVAPASQRPLPLAAPGGPAPSTAPLTRVPPPPSEDEGDLEEVLEQVWDSNGAGDAAPIILDGVPDVSERFNRVESISIDEDDPTSMRDLTGPPPPRPARARPTTSRHTVSRVTAPPETTPLPARPRPITPRPLTPPPERVATDPLAATDLGDAHITFKSPTTKPPIADGDLSAVPSEAPRATTVPIRVGKGRGVRAPSEWATGTSPSTDRPSRKALGVQGTGPTPAVVDMATTVPDIPPARMLTPVDIGEGIVSRRGLRPSRLQWVIAAVAGGAVIGLVGWAMTRGESRSQAAEKKKESPAAASVARSADTPMPALSPASAPAVQEQPMEIPVAGLPAPVAPGAGSLPPASEKKNKKKARGSDGPAPAVAPAAAPAPPPAAAAPSPPPPRAPSLLDGALHPLPAVPVKQPPAGKQRAATTPAPRPVAAPRAASAGPILVAPNRAHRRSGSIPILSGLRGGVPISAITAKLCIDRGGSVTSVTVLTRIDADVRSALVRAMSAWRYDPIVEGGSATPACFATTFRVTRK